jgi:hypothetical protein
MVTPVIAITGRARKCPVWRMYGEQADKWHDQGDWRKDDWRGGCRWFKKGE